MKESQFWHIIDLINLASESPLQDALNELVSYDQEDIISFEQILTAYLFELDAEQYALPIYQKKPIKTDSFLYARCGVIAQGKQSYESVIEHPLAIVPPIYFEPLLYLAEKAITQKAHIDFFEFPPFPKSYETYSNKDGWSHLANSQTWIEELINQSKI